MYYWFFLSDWLFSFLLLFFKDIKLFSTTIWKEFITILFFKGQLISKCPFGVKTSSKIPTKLFLDFCPEIFCTFLGASWKLYGLSGDLVSNIINKEAYRKSQ